MKLRPAPKRLERDVQTAILALLRAHSIPAWKVGGGAFIVNGRYVKMGTRGMADIVGVMPAHNCTSEACTGRVGGLTIEHRHVGGKFIAIEVKANGKKPTLEQAAFLATVRKAGGIALVATSCDDVVRELGL